ncbi:MAG: hypothetical protein K2Q34_01700, partial [Alphaproteobacteria bacterium]|nr:hypothetical protein [Alphaproteobacteria bacterium]
TPNLSRLPKTPFLQSYLPEDHIHFHPTIPLSIHIPSSHSRLLPPDILSKIEEDHINPGSLKIFAVGQHKPTASGEDIIHGFYPQFGTDPLAPTTGDYNSWRNVDLMLTDSDSKAIAFEMIRHENKVRVENTVENGHIKMSFVRNKSSIVHPGPLDPHTHRCLEVVSPVPIRITGLNPMRGDSFWSYIKYTEGGENKALATLHLLFDRRQAEKMSSELWGGENEQRNFGRLRTGMHTQSNTEFIRLCHELNQTPEFNNREKHFQRLLPLLNYQPAQVPESNVPQQRRPATPNVRRPATPPHTRKPGIASNATKVAKPILHNSQKTTKRPLKSKQKNSTQQKNKRTHSNKRLQKLLHVKKAKKRRR